MVEENSENLLKKFLLGLYTKEQMLFQLFPLMIGIVLVTMLISNLFYPGVYDWRWMVVSRLTSPEDNPRGYYYLCAGFGTMGFLSIPYVGYVHRRLKNIKKSLTIFGTFWAYLGSFGIIMMGLTPNSDMLGERTHENFSIIGIAGFLFGLFFWGLNMIIDHRSSRGNKQFDVKWMKIGWTMMWTIVILTLIGLVLPPIGNTEQGLEHLGNDPLYNSFPMWEWFLVVGMVAYMVMFVVMIPEKVSNLKE